jgi:hypothetical protein
MGLGLDHSAGSETPPDPSTEIAEEDSGKRIRSDPLSLCCLCFCIHVKVFSQRPNSWTKSKQKSKEFSSLLFTVTFTALPWDFYFFKLSQPLNVSLVTILYTVMEKGGKPDRKPYSLPFVFRNPYRNLKSKNSQDYAQKPQQNCTFMNSVSAS